MQYKAILLVCESLCSIQQLASYIVTLYLEGKVDISSIPYQGIYYIVVSSVTGNEQRCRTILCEQDQHLNTTNNDGWSLLHWLC